MQVEIEINNKDDDILNRDEFASRLAQKIINYKPNNALTIGIMGSWGSGKTSLINLTENHLKKEKVIIIHFNPWYFSNQDNLYLQFFKQIISTLKSEEKNEGIFKSKIEPNINLFKKQDNSLKNYFNCLKESSVELNIDNLENTHILESYDSLEYHKNQCKEYINTFKCKIIVIIDDIDRMTKTEIAQIFTLVKSLADFDHFIYILSFDKLIVTKALKKVNSDYKDNYIDKIINIPIFVPQISESKIDELILSNIYPIYNKQNTHLNQFNEFHRVSEYLKLFIKDIRDLKRYMNLLTFHINYFDDELNIDDFLLILAIQLFEYELYTKINENQQLLTVNVDLFKNQEKSQELITENNEKFKNEINTYWNTYEKLLAFLFPLLNIENMPVNPNIYEKWIKEHKIYSEEYFEKYFTLSLENNEPSDLVIEKLIKMDDEKDIYKTFTKRNNSDYNHSLLHKFLNEIDELPSTSCEYFIRVLMKYGDEINLYRLSRVYIHQILIKLFEKIAMKKRFELFNECIEYPNNVLTVSEFVYEIIYNHNKLMGTNITDIRSSTIDKIRRCSENKGFLNMEFLQDMLFYWREIDKQNIVKEYVLDNVKTNEEIISFLAKFRTKSDSQFYIIGGGSEAHLVLDLDELEKYHGLEIYDKVVKIKLNELDVPENIKELCEIFLKQYEEYKIIKNINS